jgi:uncharacterized membrane protein
VPKAWKPLARLIEIGAAAIEAMAVLLIAGAFSRSFSCSYKTASPATAKKDTSFLWVRSLSLGLEFLVATGVIAP